MLLQHRVFLHATISITCIDSPSTMQSLALSMGSWLQAWRQAPAPTEPCPEPMLSVFVFEHGIARFSSLFHYLLPLPLEQCFVISRGPALRGPYQMKIWVFCFLFFFLFLSLPYFKQPWVCSSETFHLPLHLILNKSCLWLSCVGARECSCLPSVSLPRPPLSLG